MENPADKQAKLQEAMSRAKKLIKLESNGTLDKIAANARDGINDAINNPEEGLNLLTVPKQNKMQLPINESVMGSNAVNVPSKIRESFANKTIDNSVLYSAFGGDIGGGNDLDFLMESVSKEPNEQVRYQAKNVKQLVSEGLNDGRQQYTSSQIDYPMIRTIVEEIVRKYTVSLKNKILTESKQANQTAQINTLAFGESFKFLDTEGNIYEAKLVKKGNIKDKKKQ